MSDERALRKEISKWNIDSDDYVSLMKPDFDKLSKWQKILIIIHLVKSLDSDEE